MPSTNLRKPPRGWKAWFWRAPIWLYRWHLGWLLGKRFLHLTHIGRKSGIAREAVLEVVHHTQEAYYVVSGFGEKSQWYKNILDTPEVKIQIGRNKMNALAERLPLKNAEEILSIYAKEHPRSLRELMKVVGLSYDGSKKSLHNLAETLPVIAFHIQKKE